MRQNTSTMKKHFLIAMAMLLATVTWAGRTGDPKDNEDMCYKGKIGPYPVTMFITVTTSSEASDVVGRYYYDERPKSVFKLKCTSLASEWVESGGASLVLKEYTAKGNNTGTFKGFISHRNGSFGGTFTNKAGKKFDFFLEEYYPNGK